MKLLSAAQMRALDRHVIDELGVPGLGLMERAGEAVAATALEMCEEHDGSVLVLCGKGNNGGDGLVAARLLHGQGVPVQAILPFAPDNLSPDARAMYELAVGAGVRIAPTVDDDALAQAGIVIDALLGTGVTGAVRGEMADLIDRTNRLRAGRGVLGVDLPSGVETDTGTVYGPAMRCEVTITMALPKPCLLLYPGAELAGRWTVVDIGFPPEVLAAWPAVAEMPEFAQVAGWVPRRPATAHKASAGFVLIIAGSYGMTGAAVMASRAAYRSGAGLVRLSLPAALVPALNATLTEAVFRPMPATPAGTLGFQAVRPLLAEAAEVRATLIGPGLSRQKSTQLVIQRLVAQWPGPLVVDADGLTAMAGQDALWGQRQAPTVITPHPGEMSRLLGRPVPELEADRIATAKEAAQRFNAVTVYKGAPTVIAAPDGRCYVNPTGNPGLAVAGTGDVLAGSITALLGQGVPPLEAATLATYMGGMAAEMTTETIGIHGMTAPDLIDALPFAMRQLVGELIGPSDKTL